MLGLVIIDMQRWMFRYPERAAQLPLLVANINALANAFIETGLPIFDIQTIHKADRSTWSRLMRKYNYSCLIEGTQDAELVDGYCIPEGANQITKTANSAFLGTNFELNAENITACPPSGRNSTYRPVQISGTTSVRRTDSCRCGTAGSRRDLRQRRDWTHATGPPRDNPGLVDRRLRIEDADLRAGHGSRAWVQL